MRNVFLGLLAREPAHGYELKQALDELSGGVWPPMNVGQIYTTLGRLERDGLVQSAHVSQASRPDKRVYEITPAGRTALEVWLDAPAEGPRLKDEFVMKLTLAYAAGVNTGHEPAALIERQRRHYLQTLRTLNDLAARPEVAANATALLLIDGAMLHLQADLKWLELCEARLAEERKATWTTS